MISFLRGTVFAVGQSYIDVDVHGVGYRVFVTTAWAEQLDRGDEVFVYAYQVVREDAIQLFGFASEADRDWFELLLGVSGVGPKGALQILSGTSGNTFAEAIYSEDLDVLCSLPGVGKKTAQRLIVELKDKLAAFAAVTSRPELTRGSKPAYASPLERDVIEALVSLGYNERQAVEQVREVLAENPALSLEAVIRLCLQRLSR